MVLASGVLVRRCAGDRVLVRDLVGHAESVGAVGGDSVVSKTIWKFPLAGDGTVMMPIGAKILTVHGQGNDICVWAEVDPRMDKVERLLSVYGTGDPLPDNPGNYLGTAMLMGGALVFHVYEKPGS